MAREELLLPEARRRSAWASPAALAALPAAAALIVALVVLVAFLAAEAFVPRPDPVQPTTPDQATTPDETTSQDQTTSTDDTTSSDNPTTSPDKLTTSTDNPTTRPDQLTSPHQGCSFNINSGVLPSIEPLFLLPQGSLDVNGYLLPDGSGNIDLAPGDKLLVACPGAKVGAYGSEVVAECKTGTTFVVEGQTVDLKDLSCSQHPTHNATYTGATCGQDGRGRVALIGHSTSRGFVSLIEACFLESTLEALYATAIVSGSINGSRKGGDRPDFEPGTGFYGGVDPNWHYNLTGQRAAFAEILDSEKLASHYIDKQYRLTHGHLASRADFVWAQQQRATFYYINAAPQWQTFNGSNWERLESSVRRLAATRERDLLVITGTWDRARLPNSQGKATDLFINSKGLIPVPALYWKVVFDSSTGEGAAFVGVNNPYTTLDDDPRLMLCEDVCAAISWVSWAPDSVKAGEGYCCEVDALRAAIPDVPQLKVTALLAEA